jgi:hypothetical protein
VNVGIYNFQIGDGKIYEPLSQPETFEKPAPRPIVKKRKIERFNPMSKFEKDANLWHKRFCHKSGMRRTIRFQGCLGLPATYKELKNLHCLCEACLSAKMAHCLHPPVFRRQWKLGQFLHIDNHAKPVLSWNKKRYTIMIVEHVSKFNFPIHILKKDQAGHLLVYAIRWFERRTGTKVLAIQCDSAGEFVGEKTEIYAYCMEEGITIQATSRSSPEENGVAEAYNKVTWYSAEALKYHSKTPDRFWTERERHVCLVQNP